MHRYRFCSQIGVENHHICFFSDFQRTYFIIHPQGSGTVNCGHFQHLLGGNYGRVHGVRFMKQCRAFHQLDHVLGIIAGSAVHPQSDCNARLQHPRDRRNTRGEVHVADGIVGDFHVIMLDHSDIPVAEMDAVNQQHIGANYPQFLQRFGIDQPVNLA